MAANMFERRFVSRLVVLYLAILCVGVHSEHEQGHHHEHQHEHEHKHHSHNHELHEDDDREDVNQSADWWEDDAFDDPEIEQDRLMEENPSHHGLFEGDLILTRAQLRELLEPRNPKVRNVMRDKKKRWPGATVPYVIVKKYFDDTLIAKIKAAMKTIMKDTCIQFVKREKHHEDYVEITGKLGQRWCSHLGHIGGKQMVNLGQGNYRPGVIVHELLHCLGMYHQQSTYNRDDYVVILWDNVKPGREMNFEKHSVGDVTQFGLDYDYESIMHYRNDSFAKHGEVTIIAKEPNKMMGQRVKLSEKDIKKLNYMYCDEYSSSSFEED